MEEIFRKRLKEELIALGMRKKELAEKVGVTPEMITQYLNTKKLPKLDTFVRICKALDVSADYMLGMSD